MPESVLCHFSWFSAEASGSLSGFGAIPWATCLSFSVTSVVGEMMILSALVFSLCPENKGTELDLLTSEIVHLCVPVFFLTGVCRISCSFILGFTPTSSFLSYDFLPSVFFLLVTLGQPDDVDKTACQSSYSQVKYSKYQLLPNR